MVGSRKRLAANSWDAIRLKYPRGGELCTTVISVDGRGVFTDIEPGVRGFVPAEEFRRAGFEYADYESRMRVGETLYVYVTRVVAGEKQRINLGLQINRNRST